MKILKKNLGICIMTKLPRAQESNPLNLTDLEFSQLKREVQELKTFYPELSYGMLRCAWIFHYIEKQKQTEQNKKIEN